MFLTGIPIRTFIRTTVIHRVIPVPATNVRMFSSSSSSSRSTTITTNRSALVDLIYKKKDNVGGIMPPLTAGANAATETTVVHRTSAVTNDISARIRANVKSKGKSWNEGNEGTESGE